MKILLVTDNRFWREEMGSQRRISSLCSHLLNRGHSVDVLFQGFLYPPDAKRLGTSLPFVLDSRGYREAPSCTSIWQKVLEKWQTSLWHIKRLVKQIGCSITRLHQQRFPETKSFRRFTLQVREPKLIDFADPNLLARFRNACGRIQPDVVIIEYVRLTYLLDAGRDALPQGCLTLIDTHDVQYERQSRFHAMGERHDIDITPTEEARALSLADVVIAIQATDASKFRQLLPEQRLIVVGHPNKIYSHPPRVMQNDPIHIGFFGSDMSPNREVAQALSTRYFPQLRQTWGDRVELHLFGEVCNGLSNLENVAGITLHGFVDELADAYAAIDIIANPVTFGGGLKIKNVEALCHGRPLITTTIGAEGLERGGGTAFLVAKDDTEFAVMLANVVSDIHLRTKLGNAARQFADAYLSEESVYAELDEAMSYLRCDDETSLCPNQQSHSILATPGTE